MKNKLTTIIVIIVILVLVVIWRWQAGITSTPTDEGAALEELLQEDTTSAAQKALDSLDLGDLDAEFEAIDAELNSL